MSDVVPNSRGSLWRRALPANVTAAAAAFASGGLQGRPRGPRVAENLYPSGSGLAIIDLRGDVGPGGMTPNHVLVKPFGTDANDEAFSVRLWGISEAQSLVGSTETSAWDATLLAEVAVTLGNVAGLAGTLVGASDFYADTLTLTHGSTTDNVLFNGAADTRAAWWRSDVLGFQILGLEFQESTAAAMNALYRLLW